MNWGDTGWLNYVVITANSKYVIICNQAESIDIINIESGAIAKTIKEAHTSNIECLSL